MHLLARGPAKLDDAFSLQLEINVFLTLAACPFARLLMTDGAFHRDCCMVRWVFPTWNSESFSKSWFSFFFVECTLHCCTDLFFHLAVSWRRFAKFKLIVHCSLRELSAEPMACLHGKSMFARHSLRVVISVVSPFGRCTREPPSRAEQCWWSCHTDKHLLACKHCSTFLKRGKRAIVHLSFAHGCPSHV